MDLQWLQEVTIVSSALNALHFVNINRSIFETTCPLLYPELRLSTRLSQ